jgi:hypothetical protein
MATPIQGDNNMAAISLIGEGQSFLGENPQVVKVKKVTLGFDSGDVQVSAEGTVALANVPAGTLVLDVLSNVNEAFTALVTIDIGDGTDPDGWLATAKVAPTSAVSSGLFKRTTEATAEAFAGGKYYAAADTIDAVVAGAAPDVGELDVYIVFIENVGPL